MKVYIVERHISAVGWIPYGIGYFNDKIKAHKRLSKLTENMTEKHKSLYKVSEYHRVEVNAEDGLGN